MARPKTKTIIKQIKKRDGQIVAFEINKISRAIWLAAKAAGGEDKKKAKYLAGLVVKELEKRFNQTIIPEVEQVQDIAEKILLKKGHEKTYQAYILYRDLHSKLRNISSLVDSDELIQKYLNKQSWLVKENANMTYSLQGLNNHVASIISANFWLNKIYPRKIRKAHLYGDIHIHDLALLSPYCTGWDLKDLLIRGFGGVAGKVNSAPPKHFGTALGQLVNFFYTLQGEVAGAVAVANFDTYLAPFIAFDKLSYKEVKQAMQEFIYNMNVPTRTGFQTPFTNVTLDLVAKGIVGNEAVIIGGKPVKAKYKDFQKEMDMFNKAFAEVMLEGDAQGRVFTFPIPTYSITNNFNWNNKVLEPIWEMTRKYGIPYFANYVNSDMKPEDARSMCFAATEKIIYKNNNQSPKICYSEVKKVVDNWFLSLGRKNIELLLNGKFFKVKKVIKLKNKEKHLIKITLKNGETLRMTDDHPAMIVKKNKLVQIKAEKLKKGMKIPVASKAYEGQLGDFQLGRFIGLYIAEGSAAKKGGIFFSFNRKEKKLIDLVAKIAQERFACPVLITQDPRWQTTQVWLKSRVMVELVNRFCSLAKARDKQLKSEIFSMSKEFRQGVIDGIFLGDGYERDMEFHTTNRELRNGVAHLAASLGIGYFKRDNHKNTKGRKIFSSYVLRISTNSYHYFKKSFPQLKKRNSSIYKQHKDFWCLEIQKIEKVFYKGNVYDFQIESKEHLFQLANGIVTHNCCRLRLDNRILRKRGGLFAANPLTGSIGVVTINLPRIGYLAKTKKDFFRLLTKLMKIAKNSLLIKRKTVENFTEKGLYPYCRYYLSDVKKKMNQYWGNHFNTIGINGMNEALLNFLGKNIASPEGKSFALEVMSFMRKKLLQYQKQTGQLFNLEATPAEGTAYRFARIDKKKFPDIIIANEKDLGNDKVQPFYTNSTHLPVDYTNDIFTALDNQDEIQTKYNGGTVLHGFLGESLTTTAAVKTLVKKISNNYHLPYFTITPTFSICPKHGYIAGEHKYCPKCDAEIGYIKDKNAKIKDK